MWRARSIRLEETAHNGVIWLAVVRAASGRKEALVIGQVAASAVRMRGHAGRRPALRLFARELGVLLSGPGLGQRDHGRGHRCPDRRVVGGGRLRRGSECG
jgi:hypothetical protein